MTGHESPYFKVFWQGKEVEANFRKFRYVYSEEEDDVCELEMEFDDAKKPDEAMYKEKTEITVLWGFLGTSRIKTRKVYIQDFNWAYGGNLKVSLLCTEKAVVLKSDTNTNMYNGATMLDVAIDAAKKHNLNVVLETDKPAPIEIPANLNKLSDIEQYIKSKEPKTTIRAFNINDFKEAKKISQLNKPQTLGSNPISFEQEFGGLTAIDDKGTHLHIITPKQKYQEYSLNYYDSIPQANRSTKGFLNGLGMREKGGQMIVDTRDDNIILRKRNYHQAPIKIFEYKQGDGEVLRFVPEYKSRIKAGSGSNISFGGWDPLNKTYFNGDANNVYDNLPESLGKLQQMVDFLKKVPDKQQRFGGFFLTRDGELKYTTQPTRRSYQYFPNATYGGQQAFSAKAESTLTVRDVKVPVTVAQELNDLLKLLNESLDYLKAQNKNLYDPRYRDANGAFNNAANLRNNSNLDKNPATLETEGYPEIEVGQIVGIVGVAKIHAGNYYIIKSEHVIDGSGGYSLTSSLVRDGADYGLKDGVDINQIGKKRSNLKSSMKHTFVKKGLRVIKNTKR